MPDQSLGLSQEVLQTWLRHGEHQHHRLLSLILEPYHFLLTSIASPITQGLHHLCTFLPLPLSSIVRQTWACEFTLWLTLEQSIPWMAHVALSQRYSYHRIWTCEQTLRRGDAWLHAPYHRRKCLQASTAWSVLSCRVHFRSCYLNIWGSTRMSRWRCQEYRSLELVVWYTWSTSCHSRNPQRLQVVFLSWESLGSSRSLVVQVVGLTQRQRHIVRRREQE